MSSVLRPLAVVAGAMALVVATSGCDSFSSILIENSSTTPFSQLAIEVEGSEELRARRMSAPDDYTTFTGGRSFEIGEGDALWLRTNRSTAQEIARDLRRIVIKRGGVVCFDRRAPDLEPLFQGDDTDRRFKVTTDTCP